MREWLTLIIALLILGILLDGLRRVRARRREMLRMSRSIAEDGGTDGDEESLSSSEFPSGGARVAGYRDPNELEQVNQSLRDSYAASRVTRGAPNRIPEQVSLNLDEAVPMLMDSVVGDERRSDHAGEPKLGDFSDLDDEPDAPERSAADDQDNEDVQPEPTPNRAAPASPESETDRQADTDAAEAQQDNPEKAKSKGFFGSDNSSEATKAAAQERPKSETEPSGKMPDEVLIVNVMARRGQKFDGPALLDAMVNQNLKFGDMDIFHRHESADGHGKIIYSVANIVVPGTFEVGAMEDFQTPGISMFLSLPCPGDSLTAFNSMIDAAQAIAQQLDGELKDEHRSVMTRQTIEHARQRVIEYERKRRLNKS